MSQIWKALSHFRCLWRHICELNSDQSRFDISEYVDIDLVRFLIGV
jgi:hypothetical protein